MKLSKYSREITLLALCLCLGTGPVMAMTSLAQDDEDLVVPSEVRRTVPDKIKYTLGLAKTDDEQLRGALAPFKQSLLEKMFEDPAKLQFNIALQLFSSKTDGKKSIGQKFLKVIASKSEHSYRVPASTLLFRSGSKDEGVIETIKASAMDPNNKHCFLAMSALIDDGRYVDDAQKAVEQVFQHRSDMTEDNTAPNRAERQRLDKGLREILDRMLASRIPAHVRYAKKLKEGWENHLYTFADRAKERIKKTGKGIKGKITGGAAPAA